MDEIVTLPTALRGNKYGRRRRGLAEGKDRQISIPYDFLGLR